MAAPSPASCCGEQQRLAYLVRTNPLTQLFMPRLLTLCLLLCPLLTCGQVYFNERYPNQNAINFAAAILPTDSGYVTSGEALGYPTPSRYSIILQFLNPDGQRRRVKYYSRPGYSYGAGRRLLRLPDGGYVLAGGCHSPTATYSMLWRFNARGDTLWTRSYPADSTGGQNFAFYCCRTADGGFAITGEEATATGFWKMLLLRTDSAGHLLWRRLYTGQPSSRGFAVELTADHGFILGGFTNNPGITATNTYVVKTDSLGQVQWQRQLGDSLRGDGKAIVRPLRNGDYALLATLGKPAINGYPQFRPVVYRLDSQGQPVWRRQMGPATASTDGHTLLELADGSLLGAGQDGDPTGATPVGNGFAQGMIFKLCLNGDSVWYRNYKILTGGNSQNFLRDVTPTADGGFVCAGFLWARAPDTGTNDAWAFKIDSAGYLQAGGPPVTVQCQPVGLSQEQPLEAVTVYPNPSADGRFTVQLTKPGARLTVTDALGRTLWRGTSAEAETTLDLSRQPSGLYLLRLTWPDGRTLTRKLLR